MYLRDGVDRILEILEGDDDEEEEEGLADA